jgi:hypothetical protein
LQAVALELLIAEFSGGTVAEVPVLGKKLFFFIFSREVSMLQFKNVSWKYGLSTSL